MIAPICNGLGSVIARSWATPYTRQTFCHEPRNRDAAWKVIFVLFRSKRPLSENLKLAPLDVHSGLSPSLTRSPTASLQSSTCCAKFAKFALDTQGQIPYAPGHLNRVLITSPHLITSPAPQQCMIGNEYIRIWMPVGLTRTRYRKREG